MKTLITGSIAYDTIMVFPDRFKNHLPGPAAHLNVCFLTPEMRREFGGTSGNIAYNLKQLGGDPLVMATVGEDIEPYLYRLNRLGIDSAHLKKIPGQFTAQAFITTDLDDNQITAFHPGAMNHAHENVEGAPARAWSSRRRQGRHDPARAAMRRSRHPVRVRSRSGPADVLGRGVG
jgi:adenosine kinase